MSRRVELDNEPRADLCMLRCIICAGLTSHR
jgi:hypothetical protein